MNAQPNYQKLYKEITERFHKEKTNLVTVYLEKEEWTSLDVITVNDLLFNRKRNEELEFNQKHKAYDEDSVRALLNYQAINNLNNSEMMRLFKVSRNSISKWRKVISKKQQ